ncbi:MAG: outer membrane beta-barrel protein [Chitinophagaceae bacterium]|nr:outer membrane beta-barrel protein [Chitinophagaceae bacterium]
MKYTLTFLLRCTGAIILLAGLTHAANAQSFSVSGTMADSSDQEPILGVAVFLVKTTDTAVKFSAASDFDGSFLVENVPAGTYTLKASYLSFAPFQKTIRVSDADLALGTLNLIRKSNSLNTVVVAGTQNRSEQSGDTTAFNAGAYKTNPDATAEDLLNKMPGVSTSGGTLKVNGEEVKKILVDGKPFFGDDPNAAIKNLPSDIIDKIQVFDRASDQSQFTGFDDGNSEKTINIQTKKGRNNGMFGKITAGYGLDEQSNDGRYTVGGNLNFFNGDRRVSIVGMSNNINEQNFSTDDLLGVSSSSGSSGGSRGGSGQRGGGNNRGGAGGGGNPASNFLVSPQGGITQTQSAGINYSDNWGKKLKVSGSYFFNRAENRNTTDLTRSYLLQNEDSSLKYTEQGNTFSTNINHRLAARLEWRLDSNNEIFIIPRLSYQDNESQKSLLGNNIFNGSIPGSSLQNNTSNSTEGYNFSNSALFRHKFRKQGRTLSFNFDTRINNKTGDGSLYSQNDYIDSSSVTDQRSDLSNQGTTFGGSLNYTEPLSKKTQLQFNYSPSFTHNSSDKEAFNRGAGNYTDLDTNFSNKFENDYSYHRGGAGIRYSGNKFNFNTTLNVQSATLDGEQFYPNRLSINRTFSNVLPMAMLNYKFTKTENLRIFYRSSTNAPDISQLQNVIDNSNPLQLRVGNPALVQDYSHSVNLRYGRTNGTKGNGLFLFANATMTNNYIGSSTTVREDGVQVTMPVNLDGLVRSSAFATYSLPLKKLKSNLNLNTGINYSQLPSLINNIRNKTKNSALNGGFVLSSNISENVDFTLAYNGAYNIASSSAQAQSNFNYYSQTTSLRLNWIFLKGFVFNTNLNHSLYSGLGEGYDRSFLLWNASLGYKFLKDKSLQADIYAFDILNQNNSISRTINDYYVEDSRTTVLQRFVMLRLTYTLRAFKSGAKMPDAENRDTDPGRRGFPGGPGMPPPAGPGGPGGGPGFGGPGF